METGQEDPSGSGGPSRPRRASSATRARARSTEARAKRSGSADEAETRVRCGDDARGEISARFFFAVELAELAVFRGEGRREPLARASLREFAVDAALSPGGDVLADVSLAAFALEDLRGGKRPAVAGGGAMAEHEPLGGGGTNIQRSLPLLRAHYAAGAETTHAAATMQRFALEVDPPFLLDVARVFVPALAGGGGESPEDVLPDDLRLVPGETHRLRPGETLELRPTRRIVADGAPGAAYELDCGGGAVVVDRGGHSASSNERVPLIFVGPGAELRIRNARVEVEAASKADAVAAWASQARLAPGARIRAGEEDGVAVEATAPTTRRRGAARRASSRRRRSGKHENVLLPARRASGASRARRPEPSEQGDAADALELCFGMDARADAETDEEGASVARVSARVARLSADVNGAPTLTPLDIVATYVTREDALGENAEDARVTLSASPIAVALSMDRLAVVSRVASRLAAAAARAPTISCAAFHKTWSSTSSPDPASPTAPVLFEAGAAGTRAGAAAWSTWRPHPPPGYASLGDVVGDGGADVPPSAPTTAIRTPRVHGGADFLRTRFFRDG